MSVLSRVIMAGVLVPLGLFQSDAHWIQTPGIFLFAVALCTTGNEQLRYLLSLVALVAMVGGSAWDTGIAIFDPERKVIGLALSYFLLPLTVLVFYVKQWSSIMDRKVETM